MSSSTSTLSRPEVKSIHHIKFAVSSLEVSLPWYENVLGASRIPKLDHVRPDGTRFAVIMKMLNWNDVYLELRHNEAAASRDRGWDPVTLAVDGRAELSKWVEWLDSCSVNHSLVLTGIKGWLVVFEDPDGRRLRLYTLESHGDEEQPTDDVYWLGEV